MSAMLAIRIALAIATLVFGAWGTGNAYQLANLPPDVCASPGDTLLAAGPLAGAGLSVLGFVLTFLEQFMGGLGRELSQAARAFLEYRRDPGNPKKQRAFIIEVGDVLVAVARAKSKPIGDAIANLLKELYAEFLKDDSQPIDVPPAVEAESNRRNRR